jgi:hypothetical protein
MVGMKRLTVLGAAVACAAAYSAMASAISAVVNCSIAPAAYGVPIVPDEDVSGDGEVVQRAIAWLRGE